MFVGVESKPQISRIIVFNRLSILWKNYRTLYRSTLGPDFYPRRRNVGRCRQNFYPWISTLGKRGLRNCWGEGGLEVFS